MKTYTKTETKNYPRLIIRDEEGAESPRKNCDNLGYFITVERNHISPDGEGEIYSIVKNTADEANNTAEHMEVIKARINSETSEKVLAIYPVNRYEHGNSVYSLGLKSGFDYSNCGFYIVTDKTQKVVGIDKKDFEHCIIAELETYTKWANGEVYEYELFDEQGESVDSCSGFYSIEDIRDSLPKEFANEQLEPYYQPNDTY